MMYLLSTNLCNFLAETAVKRHNNLRLNKSKTREVVFYDNRRRHRIQSPPPLPDIIRDSTLKVLGVTFTSTLSASDHVRSVISGNAQSVYALRVLRHHGLGEDGLWTVFRAVVVSRLIYAASAWIGFTTRTDIQRIDAFLRRCKRGGYCSPDLSDFVQLVRKATIGCSEKSSTTQAMFCTDYFLLPQQRSSNTTCGVVHMIDNARSHGTLGR